jgi:hypothetical protein
MLLSKNDWLIRKSKHGDKGEGRKDATTPQGGRCFIKVWEEPQHRRKADTHNNFMDFQGEILRRPQALQFLFSTGLLPISVVFSNCFFQYLRN